VKIIYLDKKKKSDAEVILANKMGQNQPSPMTRKKEEKSKEKVVTF
jgi:hypothetical protein